MLRSVVLILALLSGGTVQAGSYTSISYDQPTIVLTEKHLKAANSPGVSSGAVDSARSSSRGSWIASLGDAENQYHDELEKLISRPGAYARISDNSGASVQFTGQVVKASKSSNRHTYDLMIESIADRHGVERGLVKAIMHTESSFNPVARSPVGARGLMQLMPATARRFNVSNSYDPQQNIEGGVKYLSWLMKRFNGNIRLVLAAYNAGEGNVDKYGGVPPFRETQDYVRKVMERYQALYKHI